MSQYVSFDCNVVYIAGCMRHVQVVNNDIIYISWFIVLATDIDIGVESPLATKVRNDCPDELLEHDATVRTRVRLQDHFFKTLFFYFNPGFNNETLKIFASDVPGVLRVKTLEGANQQHRSKSERLTKWINK